jgi:hypothetical protein
MDLLQQALRGATQPGTPEAGRGLGTLLVVGGGGAVGSAVLEQALVAGRFSRVLALVDEVLVSTLRGLVPVSAQALWAQAPEVPGHPRRPLGADSAVVIFERQRHSNRRDDAFTQPTVPQLAALAQALRQGGVRDLLVVVPHAPALMPQALAQGLATLDEAAVAALGFEHLVFVRAAQDLAERPAASGLHRVAQWCLSQLRFMVPNAEQPLRSTTLAHAVVALARLLPMAPTGTRVLAPQVLSPMAQEPARLADALRAWLHGAPRP